MFQIVKMKTAYPQMITGDGIFNDLQSYDVPWADANINEILDIAYYNHSANKVCGNFISSSVDDDNSLPQAKRNTIANMLFVLFGVRWSKLWATNDVEYNPIQNYNMTESETISGTHSDTDTETGTIGNSGTDSTAHTGTVTNARTEQHTGTVDYDKSETQTGTNSDNVFGFNSSNAVPSESSTASTTTINDDRDTYNETKTDNNTETLNNTDARTIANTETHNMTNTNEGENETERTLTRSGNIGVTTSQQMLQSERELWDWNFFNTVFEDIDKTLCLSVYEEDWC